MKKFLFGLLIFMPYIISAQTITNTNSRNTAVIPTEKNSEWWHNRHKQKLKEIKGDKRNTQVVFLGNSITNNLDRPGFHEVWEKFFGKYNPLYLGYSGDRTENVLWRIEHGEIDGIHPKLLVLLIGTNNTDCANYPTTNTGPEVAQGIIAICNEVHKKLPDTKILILKIFPFGRNPDNKRRSDNDEASRLASKIADGKTFFYADLDDIFLYPDGTIDPSIMPDYLHPSVAGTWVWGKHLYPIVTKLIDDAQQNDADRN